MTRINVVCPSELHSKHLVAEYRELPRVFALSAKAHEREKSFCIPKNYSLGKGHVIFFYDKLLWLESRHKALVAEMVRRGFVVNFPSVAERWKSDKRLGASCWKDWEPGPSDLAINRARILERMPVETASRGHAAWSPAGVKGSSQALGAESPGSLPATTAQGFQTENFFAKKQTFLLPFCKNKEKIFLGTNACQRRNPQMTKTFTRKINAIAAAQRDIVRLNEDNSVDFSIRQFETQAVGSGSEWRVTVTLIGSNEEQAALAQRLLPQYTFTFSPPEQEEPETMENVETEVAKKPRVKAPKAPKAESTQPKARRVSAYSGKSLHPAKFADDGSAVNPRREGSHGFNSMQIIISNPGISFEEYISSGGRLNDLAWDIEHGNCRVE
jgi:deoxyribonuclease (pyrimidine dimer)